MKIRGHRTQHSAFTMVELLVVVAVIALLVGIAIPSVLAGRQASRQLECKNQMRQLVMDRMHEMNTPDICSLFLCPNDPELAFREENSYQSYTWVDGFLNNKGYWLKNSNRSSHIMVLFESAPGYYSEYVSSYFWFRYRPHGYWDANIAKERVYSQIDPKRHHGSVANYAFADGHVQSISSSQIESWIFDQQNFASRNDEAR